MKNKCNSPQFFKIHKIIKLVRWPSPFPNVKEKMRISVRTKALTWRFKSGSLKPTLAWAMGWLASTEDYTMRGPELKGRLWAHQVFSSIDRSSLLYHLCILSSHLHSRKSITILRVQNDVARSTAISAISEVSWGWRIYHAPMRAGPPTFSQEQPCNHECMIEKFLHLCLKLIIQI